MLHDLDTGVARLPRFLAAADSPEEGEKGGDTKGRRDDGERSGGGVSDVLVYVVDIRPHNTDHGRKTCSFGEVRDDFTTLDPGIVVLVNEQWLNNDQDLVDVWPDHVVELVENAVNNLDEEMALLVLQRLLHEQRKDLVE